MFVIKMRWFIMFITVVCVLLLIKLRRPKNKGLFKTKQNQMKIDFINFKKNIVEDSLEIKLLLNNNMENINFQLHAQESPPLPPPPSSTVICCSLLSPLALYLRTSITSLDTVNFKKGSNQQSSVILMVTAKIAIYIIENEIILIFFCMIL